MSFTYIKSQKQKGHLVFDGFEFLMDGKSVKKTIWKCVNYNKGKCKGRVHLEDNKIYVVNGIHNHPPDTEKITNKKIMDAVRHEARNSIKPPQRIVAEVSEALSVGEIAVLPPVEYMSRTIRRSRKRMKVSLKSKVSLHKMPYQVLNSYPRKIEVDIQLACTN